MKRSQNFLLMGKIVIKPKETLLGLNPKNTSNFIRIVGELISLFCITHWIAGFKTTDYKKRMITLNNSSINSKPKSTGEGRFGKWLENLVDWNLSRFVGNPIPIWRTDNGEEEICIGSVGQLKIEIEKSVVAGIMKSNPLADFEATDFS